MTRSGGAMAASLRWRSLAGASRRLIPSACSRSKKNGVSGVCSRSRATSPWLATRAEVTWKGCGRPSGRSATASPSSTAELTASSRAAATISGTRPVISSRVLVKTATSFPDRCTWIRMPSIFHSRAAGVIRSRAAATVGAAAASIGRTGRPTWSVTAASAAPAASGPAALSAATAAAASEPPTCAARRTTTALTPAAEATASVMTPASAPWRRSPAISRTRNSRSASVASSRSVRISCRRSAWEPGPASTPTAPSAASAPASVSDGCRGAAASWLATRSPAAWPGGVPSRSMIAAYPTPIWRCVSSPDKNATATGISPGGTSRSSPAIAATLASRPGEPATAAEVRTTWSSSMLRLSPTSAAGACCPPGPLTRAVI